MALDKNQTSQPMTNSTDETTGTNTAAADMNNQTTEQSSAGAVASSSNQSAAEEGVSSTTGLGLLDSTAASLRSEPLKEKNEQAKNVIAHRMLWGQHEKMHNSVTMKQDGTMDFNDDVDEWF